MDSYFIVDGPRYTSPVSNMTGINGTNVSVTVGLMSNPAVDNFTWTLNGTKLSDSDNLKVIPGELHFMPLLVNSRGSYSLLECNNISCNSLHFTLAIYCKLWVWL